MPVRVRRATLADVDRVAEVLNEAAGWLRSRGLDHWPARFEREYVAWHVHDRECHLALDGPEAVGTFSLQASDPEIWGERPPDAMYLHRLAVRPSHAGLGRELLARAEREAAAAGRPYVRLDCGAENPSLRAYYEQAGYRHLGDLAMPGWTSSLYEKVVAGRQES